MKTKILAMYLPQFHRVKENDEWWGEGFTEWTSVKNAEPLFEGHKEPRQPLDDNYYDLMDKDTMKWQESLINKYGIDGLVFYHYYFGNGKMILEKPAENLLKWNDISIPFCFSWANESWIRSWSKLNIPHNKWNPKGEIDKTGKEILLLQEYGNKEDWKRHFLYLLPFFKDERYIKVDNKPVFMFWRPDIINVLEQMADYWRKLAVENGFAGMFFISTNGKYDYLDASYYNEPTSTIKNFVLEKNGPYTLRYQDFLSQNVEKAKEDNSKKYIGVFPGYDDTPRHGLNGLAITGSTPPLFKEYLKSSLEYSISVGNEFLFINAWNEWGEGMYLEPDKEFEYGYLEQVNAVKNEVVETEYTTEDELTTALKSLNKVELTQLERYRYFWKTFDRWMKLLEAGKSIKDFVEKYGYKKIAIYGMGMFAEHIMRELPSGVVTLGIDRKVIDNPEIAKKWEIPVINPFDEFPEVDAIIVTVGYDFCNIYHGIKNKTKCDIHSIEEVLDTLELLLLKERCQ